MLPAGQDKSTRSRRLHQSPDDLQEGETSCKEETKLSLMISLVLTHHQPGDQAVQGAKAAGWQVQTDMQQVQLHSHGQTRQHVNLLPTTGLPLQMIHLDHPVHRQQQHCRHFRGSGSGGDLVEMRSSCFSAHGDGAPAAARHNQLTRGATWWRHAKTTLKRLFRANSRLRTGTSLTMKYDWDQSWIHDDGSGSELKIRFRSHTQ